MKKKSIIIIPLVLVAFAAVLVGVGMAGWVNKADAHPGNTCNPAAGHGLPGCHQVAATTTTQPARTTTTTAAPTTTTTTTAAPTTTTTTQPAPTTTTTAPPSTTTTTVPTNIFSDVPASDPYYVQITDLAGRKIISGFNDGTFGPDMPVTRQQFAKMIIKSLGVPLSEASICPFRDVAANLDPTDPLYPDNYIAVAATLGITAGKAPGLFGPYDNLTRAQLITMVSRAANLPAPPPAYMPPFGVFSPVHYPWARKAASAGLLTGLQGMGPTYGFFTPATRGDVCVMLYNLLQK